MESVEKHGKGLSINDAHLPIKEFQRLLEEDNRLYELVFNAKSSKEAYDNVIGYYDKLGTTKRISFRMINRIRSSKKEEKPKDKKDPTEIESKTDPLKTKQPQDEKGEKQTEETNPTDQDIKKGEGSEKTIETEKTHITEEIKGEKTGFACDMETLKEIESLNDKIAKLQSELDNKNNQLSDAHDKIKNYNEQKAETLKKPSPVSFDIWILNDWAYNDEKVEVTISKSILETITKYVDSNQLLKLENVISKNYDLSSAIVQSVLIAFIRDNTLSDLPKIIPTTHK